MGVEAEGGWSVEVRLYEWRNRTVGFPGNYLWIWLYAPDELGRGPAKAGVRDTAGDFSQPLDVGAFASDLAAGKWTRIRFPLRAFKRHRYIRSTRIV